MPEHEVGQVVGALVWAHEIGRQCRVRGDSLEGYAARGQGVHRPFRVVQDLVSLRIPAHDASAASASSSRSINGMNPRDTVGVAMPQRWHRRCPAPRADDVHPDPRPLGRMVLQPAGDVLAAQHIGVEVEPALGLGLHRLEVLEEPVAQHSELQSVEDAVHLLAVPVGAGEVLDIDPELHVADELVEAAVAQHPSRCSRSESPALPLISSTCATRPVRSPYCPSHFAAVLGPTPGTPGRLSLDSPTSAARSL